MYWCAWLLSSFVSQTAKVHLTQPWCFCWIPLIKSFSREVALGVGKGETYLHFPPSLQTQNLLRWICTIPPKPASIFIENLLISFSSSCPNWEHERHFWLILLIHTHCPHPCSLGSSSVPLWIFHICPLPQYKFFPVHFQFSWIAA